MLTAKPPPQNLRCHLSAAKSRLWSSADAAASSAKAWPLSLSAIGKTRSRQAPAPWADSRFRGILGAAALSGLQFLLRILEGAHATALDGPHWVILRQIITSAVSRAKERFSLTPLPRDPSCSANPAAQNRKETTWNSVPCMTGSGQAPRGRREDQRRHHHPRYRQGEASGR
jgi:hypothetical protein